MNQTPPRVVYLVVSILGILAMIGVSSLAATMFFKNYADPAVLTAMISITSTVIGSIGTLLVSTRSGLPAGAQMTSTITTTPSTTANPQPVVVTNEPANPVETHENT